MPLHSLYDFHSEPMPGWEESGRYCTGRGERSQDRRRQQDGEKNAKYGQRARYEKTAKCGKKARYEKEWDGSS